MRPLELLFALAAAAYSAGRIVHERRRTERLAELPGPRARELHERHRRTHDRVLLAITLGFVLGAAGLWTYVLVILPRPS